MVPLPTAVVQFQAFAADVVASFLVSDFFGVVLRRYGVILLVVLSFWCDVI
jgi:hypothetical protein